MDQMVNLFTSFFSIPNISISLFLIGIGISIVFVAIWLACYWPPLFRKPWLWLWVILITSAIFTAFSLAFIQLPLQKLVGQIMQEFWSSDFMTRNILFTGIPAILVSGLVQEGAKIVPVVIYWWRKNRIVDPKFGLLLGAVAGAGFGLLESQWILNSVFSMNWSLQTVQSIGILAFTPFFERFFTIAFHIGTSAFIGYGLARGFGWQYYLLASLFHGILNYSIILVNVKIINIVQIEIFIAIWSLLITSLMLWLRWRKPEKEQSNKIFDYWNRKKTT